jgi:hypothetical protein
MKDIRTTSRHRCLATLIGADGGQCRRAWQSTGAEAAVLDHGSILP